MREATHAPAIEDFCHEQPKPRLSLALVVAVGGVLLSLWAFGVF